MSEMEYIDIYLEDQRGERRMETNQQDRLSVVLTPCLGSLT